MRLSELTECPFCGGEEFTVEENCYGKYDFIHRFDGGEADNSGMYDGLISVTHHKAYCNSCKRYLGDYLKDTLGKAAARKIYAENT